MTPPVAEKTRPSGQRRSGGRMDPRISARRTAVLRQQGRRRLYLLVGALVLVLVLVGAWFLLHSPLFSARSITVTGDVHESAAQVVAAAGLADHPAAARRQRGSGGSSDRAPALGQVGHGPRLLARRGAHRGDRGDPAAGGGGAGRHLGGPECGRPGAPGGAREPVRPACCCVTVPVAPGAAGTTLSAKDAAGLKVATTLPPSFSAQVTAVTVEPGGWVQLSMTTPIVVNIGTATQLTAKYEDVSAVLAGATLHVGDVIDVSVPDAVNGDAGVMPYA